MRKLDTPFMQKTAMPGKISLLVFAALFSTGKTTAQWNDMPVSKIARKTDIRACVSYKLPALSSGDYFTGPGGTGTKLLAGEVLTTTQTLYVYTATKMPPAQSDEQSFTLIIDSMPTINFFLHGSRRSPGKVGLQATPDFGIIHWYDTGSHGEALASGTGFITPSIAQTTTYFAEAVNGSCVSPRTPVLAMVHPFTFLRPADCGKTIKAANEKIFCQPLKEATRYRFEIAQAGDTQVLVSKVCCFTIDQYSGWKTNTAYSVRVAAEVDGYWGIYGPACNITVPESVMTEDTALKINENALDFSLVAYPNPNNGDFTLVSSHEGEFKIYGELGKLVRTVRITKENELEIRVEGLKSGVYYIVGGVHNNTVMQKVTVIR